MFVNIETKRLLLKCVDQSDREFIFEEFQNDFINKYLYDQEPMTDIEQADDLIEFYNIKDRKMVLDYIINLFHPPYQRTSHRRSRATDESSCFRRPQHDPERILADGHWLSAFCTS